jgi:multiple sugar transport system substrate-binding protein
MPKRKKGFTLLLVLLISALLGACASDNKTASSGGTSASGTIELWMNPAGFQSDDLQREWAQNAIADFNKIYPKMKVNITIVPWADSATKKQLVMSTGKDVPDAMYTFPEEMATFAANDQLLPLDDYFKDDMNDFLGIPDSSWGGKLYIAPVLLATYGMVYNVDILNEIGWDANKLPTTLEEYDQFLKQSKEKGYQSFILNNAYDNLSGFSAILWSKDTDYITLDEGKVEVGKDNEVFKTLYTHLKSWVDNGYTPQESVTDVGSNPAASGAAYFFDGKMASMYMSGIQIKDEKLQNAPFDWVVGPALKYDQSAKSVGIDIIGGFIVPKAAKHPDAVVELLRIMTNTKHGSAFALGTGYMPTRISAGNVFSDLKGYDQLAEIYANYDEVRGVVHPVVSADFNPILQTRQKILLGRSSVEEGLEEMRDFLQKDLDKVNSGNE